MSYSAIAWHDFFYIKGEKDDPLPATIGPYRFLADAQRVAEELNEKTRINDRDLPIRK